MTGLVIVDGYDIAVVVALFNCHARLVGVSKHAACIRKSGCGGGLRGYVGNVCTVDNSSICSCRATDSTAGVTSVSTLGDYGAVVDAVFNLKSDLGGCGSTNNATAVDILSSSCLCSYATVVYTVDNVGIGCVSNNTACGDLGAVSDNGNVTVAYAVVYVYISGSCKHVSENNIAGNALAGNVEIHINVDLAVCKNDLVGVIVALLAPAEERAGVDIADSVAAVHLTLECDIDETGGEISGGGHISEEAAKTVAEGLIEVNDLVAVTVIKTDEGLCGSFADRSPFLAAKVDISGLLEVLAFKGSTCINLNLNVLEVFCGFNEIGRCFGSFALEGCGSGCAVPSGCACCYNQHGKHHSQNECECDKFFHDIVPFYIRRSNSFIDTIITKISIVVNSLIIK